MFWSRRSFILSWDETMARLQASNISIFQERPPSPEVSTLPSNSFCTCMRLCFFCDSTSYLSFLFISRVTILSVLYTLHQLLQPYGLTGMRKWSLIQIGQNLSKLQQDRNSNDGKDDYIIVNKEDKQNLMSTQTGQQLMQSMINKAVNEKGSWTKHVAHACCKCEKCTCGKHKCQIKSPHLELSPFNSSYNNQFKKRPLYLSSKKKEDIQYQTYQPRQIISKSHYKTEYVDKETPKLKLEIHHDNIETGGPTFNQTTYQNCYTGSTEGPAKQIKNPETLGCTPGARLVTISCYRDTYKWHLKEDIKRQKPIKHSDNLKTEISMFTAKSRYSTDFHEFNNYRRDKSNFAPDRSYQSQKGLKTETSYTQHYGVKTPDRCPAENCN